MNEHDVLERALQRIGNSPIELNDVYRERERRHLRRRLAAGSTAIAVVALTVALFVRAIDQASPVTPVGTSPSPTGVVTYDGLPSFADMRSVAANQTGFIAVGDTSTGDGIDPVWFSPDGVSWTRVHGTSPESNSLWDAVGDANGFITVGVDLQDQPAAWYSQDGIHWTKAAVDLPAGAGSSGADAVFGVAPNGDGYLAWGRIGGDTYVWRSTDGTSWSSIADESVFAGDGQQNIYWVDTSHPGALLAGGEDGQDQNQATLYATWSSTDGGATWTKGATVGRTGWEAIESQANVPSRSHAANDLGAVFARSGSLVFVPAGTTMQTEAPKASGTASGAATSTASQAAGGANAIVFDNLPDWVDLRAIAANATGFVAVGDTSVGDNTDPVWFSSDGETWTRAPKTSGPQASNLWDVTADQNGFIAVGLGQNGDAAAWYSTDGLTWTAAAVDVSGRSSGYLNDMEGVTRIAGQYLAWGWIGGPTPYIWTSADGHSWNSIPDESTLAGPGEQNIIWMGQADDGTLYAGGWSRPSGSTASGDPALWRSADGLTWQRVQTSTTAFDQLQRSLGIRDRTAASNDLGGATVQESTSKYSGSSITFTPAG